MTTTAEISREDAETAKAKLPDGWRWAKLGEVCDIIAGQSPPSETYRKSQEGLPFFQGKADFGPRHPIARTWCVSPNKIALAGDILISVRAPVGPTNVADVKCCIGRGLAAIRSSAQVDRDFVLSALRLFESKLAKLGSGSTFHAIDRSDIETFEIPLPPLGEQKRIAGILTEQTAAVERARASAEAQLQAAENLPAAYLRAVFDRPEAQSWPKLSIGEIATIVQNGIYKPAEHYGHGRPFVRMYNVKNDSWCLNLEPLALVDVDDDELNTYGLKVGDLLLSRVNSFELVGKCAWVGPEAEGHVFENMLIRLRCGDSVDSLFVAQQMGTPAARSQVKNVAKQAIGQASINSKDIRGIRLSMPPPADQRRISAQLSSQMVSAERLRQMLTDQLDAINKLPAALLRRAFNGEV